MKEEFLSYFGELGDVIFAKPSLYKKGKQVIQLVKEKKYYHFNRDMKMLNQWYVHYDNLTKDSFIQFLKKEEVIHILINDIFDFFITEVKKQELEKIQNSSKLHVDEIKRITKKTALEQYSQNYIQQFPFFASTQNPHYSKSLMFLFFDNILHDIHKLIQKRYAHLSAITLRGTNKEEYETLKKLKVEKFKKQPKNSKEKQSRQNNNQKETEEPYKNYFDKLHFFQSNYEKILDAQPKKVYFFLGETNSSKTHTALSYITPDMKVAYLSPLRLLAIEVYERMNANGIPCSLLTGEEEIINPEANMIACTLEMLNEENYDVVIVDEYQMIEDSQRSAAITHAILSSHCERLFLVGSPDYLNTTMSFMRNVEKFYQKSLFDCEAHYFQRQSQLIFNTHLLNNKEYQKGDCIVCFSKKRIYEINNELNSAGYSTAILYGDLPLETRREQSELYHKGKVDILIASDVIGMGLNLPIKRLIFDSVNKFDGESLRLLTTQEFKQIAGRAGRGKENGEIFLTNNVYCNNYKDNFDYDYDFIAPPIHKNSKQQDYIYLINQSTVNDINKQFEVVKDKYQSDLPLFEKCFNSIKFTKDKIFNYIEDFSMLKFSINPQLLDLFSVKFSLNYSNAIKQYCHFVQEIIYSKNKLDNPHIKGLTINKQFFSPFIELMDEKFCNDALPSTYQKPSKILHLSCAPCNLFNNKSYYEEYFNQAFCTKRFKTFLSRQVGIKNIPTFLSRLTNYKQRELLNANVTAFMQMINFKKLCKNSHSKYFGNFDTEMISQLGSYYLNFTFYGFDEDLFKVELQALKWKMNEVKDEVIYVKTLLKAASDIEQIRKLIEQFNITRIMNIVPYLEKEMMLLSWLNKFFYFISKEEMQKTRANFGKNLHILISISNRFIPKIKTYYMQYLKEEYKALSKVRQLKTALNFKEMVNDDIGKINKHKLKEALRQSQLTKEQLIKLCDKDKTQLMDELKQEQMIAKEKITLWQNNNQHIIQAVLEECN